VTVRRAQGGDADAYGDLVARHRPAALRVATVVLGSADGADDVVQQATERAWRSFESFDGARPFRPWFLRIVANSARNDRRSRGRRAHLEVRAAHAGMAQEAVTPEEAAVSDVDRQRVVAALNQLDSDDRLVIALRWFEQLTEAEMVETLEVPAGTVKSRLSRAMGRLRAVLEAEGAVRG
jgi:RNA polymerase sigma factor (sigma-70 family)